MSQHSVKLHSSSLADKRRILCDFFVLGTMNGAGLSPPEQRRHSTIWPPSMLQTPVLQKHRMRHIKHNACLLTTFEWLKHDLVSQTSNGAGLEDMHLLLLMCFSGT